MQRLSSEHERVYAFHRTKDVYSVIVVLNFGADSAQVSLDTNELQHTYRDIFNETTFDVPSIFNVNIGPWDYKVYARVQN